MYQLVALVLPEQFFSRFQERDAVGDRKTDQEIDDCRNRPVGKDLDKGIDLVLFANRPHLEKSETGMHGKHHRRPQHQKKNIATTLQASHR